MSGTILVSEEFLSVQGEGPSAGVLAYFVRLHGCPVHCPWCDTKYTWDGSESGARHPVSDVVARAAASRAQLVVVTGGEPTVQPALGELLGELLGRVATVEVETACVGGRGRVSLPDDLSPLPGVLRWVLSPKPPSSGVSRPLDELVQDVASYSVDQRVLKVVVGDGDDEAVEWACALAERSWVLPDELHLMPKGAEPVELYQSTSFLMRRASVPPQRFRVGTRLQVLAYGRSRGV